MTFKEFANHVDKVSATINHCSSTQVKKNRLKKKRKASNQPYTLNYNIVWMDPRSPQYKLLEPSSDKGRILQDGMRPIEKMCSGSTGFRSSVTPPLNPTTVWNSFGFYHESRGSAERERTGVLPEASGYSTNQFQTADNHISSFSSHCQNTYNRSEYSTCSPIYHHWPLDYPRGSPAYPGQVEPLYTEQKLSLAKPHFGNSHCYGVSSGSLQGGMHTVPRTLALGFPYLCPKTSTRQRKKRIPYSNHQKAELEKAFEKTRFLTPEIRLNISSKLALTERQVKIWFQNQRQKEKKLLRVQQHINPNSP
ncbi:homeobox protein Hox-C8-like [Huso huso]|uniref:Homeobox protein Hox-C8-like n=1 Tax=Huso huso TaxID=61971 RepID=A0ABR0ZFA9_HUSHU